MKFMLRPPYGRGRNSLPIEQEAGKASEAVWKIRKTGGTVPEGSKLHSH